MVVLSAWQEKLPRTRRRIGESLGPVPCVSDHVNMRIDGEWPHVSPTARVRPVNPLLILINPPELSDEAAYQILDFLHELATAFENHYGTQLRRYPEPDRPPQDDSEDPFAPGGTCGLTCSSGKRA